MKSVSILSFQIWRDRTRVKCYFCANMFEKNKELGQFELSMHLYFITRNEMLLRSEYHLREY